MLHLAHNALPVEVAESDNVGRNHGQIAVREEDQIAVREEEKIPGVI